MEKVKVNKNRLIAKLQENRETHQSMFLKAMEGYRRLVIKDFHEILDEAIAGRPLRITVKPDLRDMPVDRTDTYDEAIGLLFWSVEEEVFLTPGDYKKFILDKWDWSEFVTETNLKYSDP